MVSVMSVATGAHTTIFDDFEATVKLSAFGTHNCRKMGRGIRAECDCLVCMSKTGGGKWTLPRLGQIADLCGWADDLICRALDPQHPLETSSYGKYTPIYVCRKYLNFEIFGGKPVLDSASQKALRRLSDIQQG